MSEIIRLPSQPLAPQAACRYYYRFSWLLSIVVNCRGRRQGSFPLLKQRNCLVLARRAATAVPLQQYPAIQGSVGIVSQSSVIMACDVSNTQNVGGVAALAPCTSATFSSCFRGKMKANMAQNFS